MSGFPDALRKATAARVAMVTAVAAGVREYVASGFRAEPIVRQHFTTGNQSRYGWPPLSPGYARWKDGSTPDLKRGMKAAGKVVPKGKALPMLVLTGALRDAIASGRAVVAIISPEVVTATWTGLPEYAVYHHKGEGVPKRSPILPNAADRQAIIMAARRYLSAAIGTGGAVPVAAGGAPVPGRARVQ